MLKLLVALAVCLSLSKAESVSLQATPEFPGKFNANNYLPPDPLAPSMDQKVLPAIPVLEPLPLSGDSLPASPAERIALRLSMQGTPVDYTAEMSTLASLVKKQKNWLDSAKITRSKIQEQINDQATQMKANEDKMNELHRVMEEENNAIHREKLLTMVENANAQVKLLKDQISNMQPSPQAQALAQAVADMETRLSNLESKAMAPVPVTPLSPEVQNAASNSTSAAPMPALPQIENPPTLADGSPDVVVTAASLLEHTNALAAQDTATAASAVRRVRAEEAASRSALAKQQAINQGKALEQASSQMEELTHAIEIARSQLTTSSRL